MMAIKLRKSISLKLSDIFALTNILFRLFISPIKFVQEASTCVNTCAPHCSGDAVSQSISTLIPSSAFGQAPKIESSQNELMIFSEKLLTM